MNQLKQLHKRKLVIDIGLILLVNVILALCFREIDLVKLLYEYTCILEVERYIPLLLTLLLSVLYFAIRRWRESCQLTNLAERRASMDPLTKLLNRRTLESKLLLEWQRFIRYQETFCLLKLKVDDLKVINTAFSSSEGDRILIEIAEKLLKSTRETDFCSRWAGSEFAVLLPVTELPLVIALAERLRADIYRLLEEGVELSVSIGVAQSDQNQSLEKLLKEVDSTLEKAKKTGGNCVVSG